MHSRIHRSFLAISSTIFIIVLICIFILPTCVQAQNEEGELFIHLFDYTVSREIPMDPPYEFIGGKDYYIAVAYENETGNGYTYNVNITVPWGQYITSELYDLPITAPHFDYYKEFSIRAEKNGYIPDEVKIEVLRGILTVTTYPSTVKENERFLATVIDQDGRKINGTTVYIDVEAYEHNVASTDENGNVFLIAPPMKTDNKVTLIAHKSGYKDATTTILVQTIPSPFASDVMFIGASALIVIVAIIVVSVRNRRLRQKNDRTLMSEKYNEEVSGINTTVDKKPLSVKEVHTDGEVSEIKRGPKVEEIRIHRPDKQKETKFISPEEHTTETLPRKIEKNEYEWFEGTDDIRYKIDKLTGKVDEEHVDKWFEGTDDVRSKIDETLSKKHKKKDK